MKCTLVSNGFIPLSAQTDDSDFKIYMSDIGLLGAKAQIPATMLLTCVDIDNTFLSSVAENHVAQQLQTRGYAFSIGRTTIRQNWSSFFKWRTESFLLK